MLQSKLSTRLPDFRSIVPVFAVVSLVLYGWTFISIFWKLNSWRMNLNEWEIFSLISYSMVQSFLESVLIVAGMLGLSLLLPSKLGKEQFIARGSIAALCVLSSMILHLKLYAAGVEAAIVQSLGQWWLVTCILTVILAGFLPVFHIVRRVFDELANRAIVFLYLFLPMTVLGLFVLVIRFLFTNW